jgi:hypothetical protein
MEGETGLLRPEAGRHMAFYRRIEGGIVILRIPHLRMLPDKSELGDAI